MKKNKRVKVANRLKNIIKKGQEEVSPELAAKKEEYLKKFDEFIDEFNSKSSIVKLKKKKAKVLVLGDRLDGTFTFEVVLDFDKYNENGYIDTDQYKEGRAYIYLTDKFFEDVDELGKKYFGKKPMWNNIGTVGWFSIVE